MHQHLEQGLVSGVNYFSRSGVLIVADQSRELDASGPSRRRGLRQPTYAVIGNYTGMFGSVCGRSRTRSFRAAAGNALLLCERLCMGVADTMRVACCRAPSAKDVASLTSKLSPITVGGHLLQVD